MSIEAAAEFLSGSSDLDLVTRAAESDDPASVFVAAGSAAGREFTAEELRAVSGRLASELTEADLDGIAAGVPAIGPIGRAIQTYRAQLTDAQLNQVAGGVPEISPLAVPAIGPIGKLAAILTTTR